MTFEKLLAQLRQAKREDAKRKTVNAAPGQQRAVLDFGNWVATQGSDGLALQNSVKVGKQTFSDLTVNKAGKVVSKARSDAGKRRPLSPEMTQQQFRAEARPKQRGSGTEVSGAAFDVEDVTPSFSADEASLHGVGGVFAHGATDSETGLDTDTDITPKGYVPPALLHGDGSGSDTGASSDDEFGKDGQGDPWGDADSDYDSEDDFGSDGSFSDSVSSDEDWGVGKRDDKKPAAKVAAAQTWAAQPAPQKSVVEEAKPAPAAASSAAAPATSSRAPASSSAPAPARSSASAWASEEKGSRGGGVEAAAKSPRNGRAGKEPRRGS